MTATNHDTLEAGRTGLWNPGNHCYLLSVCQALTHTDPLRDFLIEEPIEELIDFNKGRSKGMVSFNFAILVRQLWSNKFTSLRTKFRLKKELGIASGVFQSEEQQDASELLINLIELLIEDFGRPIVTIESGINDDNIFAMAAQQWAEFKASHESPIADIFHYQIVNTVRCRNRRCNKPKLNFEVHCFQLVEIVGKSLQSSLAHLYSPKTSDVKKTCDFCNKQDFVEEDLKIWSIPKVLIFMLGRQKFRSNSRTGEYGYVKINDFIQYPDKMLDIRPYCHPENVKRQAFYDLYAVVNHMGSSLTEGHYVAIAKRSHNSGAGWRKFNDSKVSDVTSSEAVNKSGYILFYRLRGSE